MFIHEQFIKYSLLPNAIIKFILKIKKWRFIMFLFIQLLGQCMMAFSILIVVFKFWSINTAGILFIVGLLIYLIGKFYRMHIQK
ncbi:hypothetical protein CHH60_16545 [Paenibacillus sp. 7523-1]|nr:hypothetical protein CHH60_16545 [Paenibacillus sp. 7523-1]